MKKQTLSRFINGLLYAIAFFIPLSFLSGKIFAGFLGNYLLVTILIGLSFLAGLIKAMCKGEFIKEKSFLSKSVLFFLVIVGTSYFLSASGTHSLWAGAPSSLFHVLLYGLLFFNVVNLVGKEKIKRISRLLNAFTFGGGLLGIALLLRVAVNQGWLKGLSFLSFSSSTGETLAIFFGGLLVITIARLLHRSFCQTLTKKRKIVGWGGVLIFTLSLLAINYWVAWLLVFVSLVIILFSSTYLVCDFQKQIRRLVAPLFFLAIIGILVVISGVGVYQTRFVGINQVRLSAPDTIETGVNAAQNSAPEALFGGGPASFSNQYQKYHPLNLNRTVVWNTPFSQGYSWLFDSLVVYGGLGLLSLLLIIGFFGRSVIRYFKSGRPHKLALTGGVVYFLGSWLLHPGNVVILLSSFLVLALWALIFGRRDIVNFVQEPQKAFFSLLFLLIALILTGVGGYFVRNHYQAQFLFQEAWNEVKQQEITEPLAASTEKKITESLRLGSQEPHCQLLTQLYIAKIKALLGAEEELSPANKQKALDYKTKVDRYFEAAQKVNPENYYNYTQEARFLALVGDSAGAQDKYVTAQHKAPRCAQIPMWRAQLYLQKATQEETENINQYYQKALAQLKETLKLKNNYADAYLLRGQIYQQLGEDQKAFEAYSAYQQVGGQADIQNLIDQLEIN